MASRRRHDRLTDCGGGETCRGCQSDRTFKKTVAAADGFRRNSIFVVICDVNKCK